MNGQKNLAVVAFDQERVYAAGGDVSSGEVRSSAWLAIPYPKGMDVRDGGAVGVWLAQEFKKADLGRPKLIFAASRGEVVMKRMRLPKPTGKSAHEIAGMVRLQMARQVTVPLEGTAIDFLPLGEEAVEGGATMVGVLAAAMPGDRLLWYDKVARGAGCKVERIGLRPAGLAAMLAEVSLTHSGPILGVGVGSTSVEIVVVGNGHLLFARSADLGVTPSSPGDDAASSLVQRIAIEAKRTWMSYRVSDESSVVDAVVVAGEGKLAKEIAEKCGEALEMPWKLVSPAGKTELPRSAGEHERLVAVPVLGVLLEQALGRESLNFAKPRQAPDVAAARRQAALAAALGLIVVGGLSGLVASRQLSGLRGDLHAAQARGQTLQAEYNQYLKRSARLDHLKAWTESGVDWVTHARRLSDVMPDPRQAELDVLSGHLLSTVTFTAKDGRYDSKGWHVAQEADFSIAGHSKRRDIVDDFRRRLIAMYDQVQNKGPDVPDRFALDFSTAIHDPEAPAPPAKPSAPSKGGSE